MTRCGPCGRFFANPQAAREHLRSCGAFQRATSVPPRIIDAPPGGPRAVKRVTVFPGVGALPADPPNAKKKRRGPPSRYGNRYSLARSVTGTYLSWLAFYQFVQWCYRHLSPKVFQRLDQHVFWYQLANFPGADRIAWSERKAPAEQVISLLARHHHLSRSTIGQLVREGQWWDRIEEKYLDAASTMKAQVQSDTGEVELLARSRRRLGRRRRLSMRESISLLLEWFPVLRADIKKWAPIPREARLSKAYLVDRQRLTELLNLP